MNEAPRRGEGTEDEAARTIRREQPTHARSGVHRPGGTERRSEPGADSAGLVACRLQTAVPAAVASVIASARSPDDLEVILEHIHDHWLDLSAISFVDDTLRIPVTDRPSRRVSEGTTFPWSLVVRQVEGWSFDDQAEVGFYDINDITYDTVQRVLHIRCGVPLVISARVRDIEVSVE